MYKGIHGLSGEDITYKSDLARQLRRHIASLAGGEDPNDKEPMSNAMLKRKLSAYIKQIETENPYATLPSAERTILLDIKEMIASDAKDGALRKLDDLGGLVQVRQEALDKVTSLNKWSTPLAVIGLVLTVVFGILSMI